MNIVLVNPPVRSGRYASWQTSIPPAGIGYLAAYLEQHDFGCSVIDGKLWKISIDEVCDQLCALNPDLIGFSAMTPDMPSTGEISRRVKEKMPGVITVMGGAHAIAIPHETLQEFPHIDFVITGEGEDTFVELVTALSTEKDFSAVPGLGYRDESMVIVNPHRPYIKDLDRLPFPAWHKFGKKSDTYFVLSSRGCPYGCLFCMRALGSQVRDRSPENVIAEIEWLVENFAPRKIIFIDETFTLKKKRILEFTDLMIKKGLHRKVRWVAQTRVDRGDPEIFARMKAAGCYRVEFGVESGNQSILNHVDKNINLSQVRETVRMARDCGLQIACTFILGHPYESEETIGNTINFAVTLKPDFVSFGIMSPYPGTGIWEMAKTGKGNYRLLSDGWDDYMRFGGGALELVNISRRRLEVLQAKAYFNFYLRTLKLVGFMKYSIPRMGQILVLLKKLIKNQLMSKRDRSVGR